MITHRVRRGITLIELLVSLACLAIFVLYFSAFEQIARQDLFGTERRARVQNEASLTLETIAKTLNTVIGNPSMMISGTSYNPIYVRTPGNTLRIKFKYDSNNNGEFDAVDRTGCFRIREGGNYEAQYSGNSGGNYWGGACSVGSYTPISSRIIAASVSLPDNHDGPFDLTTNNITVSLTTCWDPTEVTNPCGHQENPQVEMSTTITMPMVSVR